MGRIDHLDVKSLAASLAESGDARIDGLVRADATRSSHAGSAFPTEGGVVGPSGGVAPVRVVVLFLIALLAGAGVMFGVERSGLERATVLPAPPPQIAPGPIGVGALGRVEPASRIRRLGPPSALAVNRVDRLFVHEGDSVAAGQVLAEFGDARLKDAAVQEANAKVAEAQANLALVKAAGRPSEIEALKARIDGLTAQQNMTARDAGRSAELVPSGAAARAIADRDRAAADRAAANLREADAQLLTLEQPRPEEVALAESRLQTAVATLASARADAALARIYAPISGKILKIYARPGDLVGSEGLLDLADIDNLDVVADVYETDLPRVHLGAKAEITALDEPQERYTARVVEIGQLVRHTTEAGVDPVARVDGRTVEVRLALSPAGVKSLSNLIGMQMQVAISP